MAVPGYLVLGRIGHNSTSTRWWLECHTFTGLV